MGLLHKDQLAQTINDNYYHYQLLILTALFLSTFEASDMTISHTALLSGTASVTLEIPLGKLKELFFTGQLRPCDIRCVDCASKLIIQRLCLEAWANQCSG